MSTTSLTLGRTAVREPQFEPARLDHWLPRPQTGGPSMSQLLRARWNQLRQRLAQARSEREIQALADLDHRVQRDLQTARDLAEWTVPHRPFV